MTNSEALKSDHQHSMIIAPYRYARGVVAVKCPSDGGYKTNAARLVEACGGRWCHRADGYLLSKTKLHTMLRLHSAGWTGEIGITRPQRLIAPDNRRLTYAEAKRELPAQP